MYLKQVEINNIRSIVHFEMNFQNEAGWHVLIGDNGTGKSSIIRSIALALIGPDEALGIRPNWNEWLQKGQSNASILLQVKGNPKEDEPENISPTELRFQLSQGNAILDTANQRNNPIWSHRSGFFSAGFGPFRRFTGGSKEYESIFKSPSLAKLASHLSLFGEDVALTEATDWLMKLHYQVLEAKSSNEIVSHLKKLINSPEFLPRGARLTEISSEGVFFEDGNGAVISVNQLSDGFRSILSLTFELIRQLVRVYDEHKVFRHIAKGRMYIDLPGVVLIDEVDAHLHPTWQTRIGQWFLKYFPNIQFIVTSHSPLVCRACERGSIWRLAAPGSDNQSGEVTGKERDRLIYGNILDAYGTEVFGENVSISKEANEKLNELAELNIKSMMGEITDEEEVKLNDLKSILPTENSVKK